MKMTVELNLSDNDAKSIHRLCGKHGISLSCLLENFIGDLIDGDRTNGSDERLYAERYFERCWFGMFPEKTLLHNLLSCEYYYDVREFFQLLDDIQTAKDEVEYYEEHPEEEGLEWAKEEYEQLCECLAEIKSDFSDETWEEEVEKVKKWWNEFNNL